MTAAPATCPACAEPVRATDRFCEGCGRDLRTRRATTTAVASSEPCSGCGEPAGPVASEYCPGCGLRRDDGTRHVEIDLGELAGVSDRGRRHARNEDAMALARRDTPLGPVHAAVVCDGVSSSPRPQDASRAAAQAALDVLLRPGTGDTGGDTGSGDAEAALVEAVRAAAVAVSGLARRGAADAPACTLVAAVVEPPGPQRAARISVGWIGDSRAYWLADPDAAEPARTLTRDHSWAAELVAAGAFPDAAAVTGPGAHAITRWLGADGGGDPEVTALVPAGPGVLLLCTDGLWNHLPEPDRLAATVRPLLAAGASPLAVAVELTALANRAGGHDNITVVVLPVAGPTAADPPPTTPRRSP